MIEAARYLGVPPWVLAEEEWDWYLDALECMSDKNWAEAEAMKQTKHRRGGKG